MAIYWEYAFIFLRGIGETLLLATVSLFLGLILGLILSFWSKKIRIILLVFQSLPETLILFTLYFGLEWAINKFTGGKYEINTFFAATISLSLIFASYASRIFHMALQHISEEEKNVARTLQLSESNIFFHITLPQIWQYALPGLGSLWLILLKDTTLISLIGGYDLFARTQILVRNTGEPFVYYGLVAIIFLLLSFVSEKILFKVQNKAKINA